MKTKSPFCRKEISFYKKEITNLIQKVSKKHPEVLNWNIDIDRYCTDYKYRWDKRYRLKNIELCREYWKRWRSKRPTYSKEYREKNKDYINKINRENYKKNRERILEKKKAYQKTRRNKIREYERKYFSIEKNRIRKRITQQKSLKKLRSWWTEKIWYIKNQIGTMKLFLKDRKRWETVLYCEAMSRRVHTILKCRPNVCMQCWKECKPDFHHTEYPKWNIWIYVCKSCHAFLNRWDFEPKTNVDLLDKIKEAWIKL